MRADARRNYKRLLHEPKLTFLEHGVGTLYRHFPTRLALQEAVYHDEVEELCARAYTMLETEPPGTALAGWMSAFAAHVMRKHGLMQTLKEVIDPRSEPFGRCHGEVNQARITGI